MTETVYPSAYFGEIATADVLACVTLSDAHLRRTPVQYVERADEALLRRLTFGALATADEIASDLFRICPTSPLSDDEKRSLAGALVFLRTGERATTAPPE